MLHFFCNAAKVGFKLLERKIHDLRRSVADMVEHGLARLLGGAVAGFIAGFIIGFIGAMLGQADAAAIWGGIAGLIVAIPVSLWAMKAAINKHHLRPTQTST
jgi:predicted PurR-regulated permease PerM